MAILENKFLSIIIIILTNCTIKLIALCDNIVILNSPKGVINTIKSLFRELKIN